MNRIIFVTHSHAHTAVRLLGEYRGRTSNGFLRIDCNGTFTDCRQDGTVHEHNLPLVVEPTIFDVYLGGADKVITPNHILIKNAKFTKGVAGHVGLPTASGLQKKNTFNL